MSRRLDGRSSLAYVGVKPTQPPSLIIARRAPIARDIEGMVIGSIWINSTSEIWMLLGVRNRSALWVLLYPNAMTNSVGYLTGDTGGAVGPDGAANINIVGTTNNVTVTGNPGANTLTLDVGGSIPLTFTADDAATATASMGNVNLLGIAGIITAVTAINTIDFSQTANVSLQFDEDTGSATSAANVLEVLGGTGISTGGATNVITITGSTNSPSVFHTDSGDATPAANEVTIAGGTNIATSGSGSTVTADFSGTLTVVQGGTDATSYTPYTVITAGTVSTDPLTNVVSVGTAAQVLTSNGAAVYPTFQDSTAPTGTITTINTQIFTSSGTYTPTAGMVYCIVECVGGGGGGGATTATGATSSSAASGGGGGGYARSLLDAAAVGASQIVTIGAGGAGGVAPGNDGSSGSSTSFGALVIGVGAVAGQGATASTTFRLRSGGVGAGGNTGDISVAGGSGGLGVCGPATCAGGAGGKSFYAGRNFYNSTSSSGPSSSVAGTIGNQYGGGGSGAVSNFNSLARAGGAGYQGICIVTEFISA